ncbi:MAG: hypothetical protein HW397_24 [Dehalococcoidia bacterium]|nr:hypothetical protein [Dehalococcoidia bacterium]
MAAESVSSSGLVSRMMRALRLDIHLYEEVENDKGATKQAAAVVIFASIIAGLGFASTGGALGLVLGIAVNFIGWALWAWLNYFIGSKLLAEKDTHADWGQLARAMGFAYTPRIFLLLVLIPVMALQGLITLVVVVWVWIGMVLAVRSALDYKSTLRAVGVTLIGAIINGIALYILRISLGVSPAA